jgi:hypothetical protein
MKRILAALTLLALCSCAGGKEKAYSGPDRPSQSVAVIKGNYGTFEDGSMILGVDGTAFDTARDEVEVLPGSHQIAFVYWDKDPSFFPVLRNFTGSFQLEAEAGHSYEIRGEGGQGFHHWEPLQIWAVDLGTETTIWKAAPILTAP